MNWKFYLIGLLMLVVTVIGALAVQVNDAADVVDNDDDDESMSCKQELKHIKKYIKTHEDNWESDTTGSSGSGMSFKRIWKEITGYEPNMGHNRITLLEYLNGQYVTRAEFEEFKDSLN